MSSDLVSRQSIDAFGPESAWNVHSTALVASELMQRVGTKLTVCAHHVNSVASINKKVILILVSWIPCKRNDFAAGIFAQEIARTFLRRDNFVDDLVHLACSAQTVRSQASSRSLFGISPFPQCLQCALALAETLQVAGPGTLSNFSAITISSPKLILISCFGKILEFDFASNLSLPEFQEASSGLPRSREYFTGCRSRSPFACE